MFLGYQLLLANQFLLGLLEFPEHLERLERLLILVFLERPATLEYLENQLRLASQ